MKKERQSKQGKGGSKAGLAACQDMGWKTLSNTRSRPRASRRDQFDGVSIMTNTTVSAKRKVCNRCREEQAWQVVLSVLK